MSFEQNSVDDVESNANNIWETASDDSARITIDGGEVPTTLTTDEGEIDELFCATFDSEIRTLHNLAYDVQVDLQKNLDIGHASEDIVYETDDYVIIASDQFWPEAQRRFSSDIWSDETTNSIIDTIREMHIDVAHQAMDSDRLADISGVVDLAVVFTE